MTAHPRDDAYYSLVGPAAALYRQLGACPAEWVDVDGLSALTDLDALASERLAEILIDAGLLDVVDGRFALGSEGHLHARVVADAGEVDEGDLNAEGLSRYFAFLKSAAWAAERLITPSHRPLWGRETPDGLEAQPPFLLDEADALDWLERQLPNYLAVLRLAYLDRRYALVCDLLTELLATFSQIRGTSASVRACLNLRVLTGTWVVLWCVMSVGWRRPGTDGVRICCSTARAGRSIR